MTDSPKRRWFAFRLRTLLVVVVVLGCVLTPLAIKVKRAGEQKKIVVWVLENWSCVWVPRATARIDLLHLFGWKRSNVESRTPV